MSYEDYLDAKTEQDTQIMLEAKDEWRDYLALCGYTEEEYPFEEFLKDEQRQDDLAYYGHVG